MRAGCQRRRKPFLKPAEGLPTEVHDRLRPSRHERRGQAQAAPLPHLLRRGRVTDPGDFVAKSEESTKVLAEVSLFCLELLLVDLPARVPLAKDLEGCIGFGLPALADQPPDAEHNPRDH